MCEERVKSHLEGVRKSGGRAPWIHNVGTGWKRMGSLMPQTQPLLHLPPPYALNINLGGSQSWSGHWVTEGSWLLPGLDPRSFGSRPRLQVFFYCLPNYTVSCAYWATPGCFWKYSINLLKPAGHVMHQQFNIQQLYVLPTLYLCVLYLSENKQRLVPLTA